MDDCIFCRIIAGNRRQIRTDPARRHLPATGVSRRPPPKRRPHCAAQTAPLASRDAFLYAPHTPGGELAERLRTGLQIREDRFDSDTRLQISV